MSDLNDDRALCFGSVPRQFGLARLQMTSKRSLECPQPFDPLANLFLFGLEQVAHLSARAGAAAG
jgi:hypothetical protein